MAKIKKEILEVIKKHTKENPVLSTKLDSMFSLKGSMLRDAVRELRRQGEPICITTKNHTETNLNGYYYCLTDAIKTINNLESRSFSMLKTAKAMREKCGLLNEPKLI